MQKKSANQKESKIKFMHPRAVPKGAELFIFYKNKIYFCGKVTKNDWEVS